MIDLFWVEGQQAFYDTGRDHEELILRPRELVDNATPSGGSVAADVLLRLSVLTGGQEYAPKAMATLRAMRAGMTQAPLGFAHWLCALDFYLSSPREVALVGAWDDPGFQALLAEVHGRYLPNIVLAGCDPSHPEAMDDSPLLEDKYMIDGKASAFVCQNYACLAPVTEPQALAEQLGAG